MAIPEFWRFLKPFLECISDGKVYTIPECADFLSEKLGLSPEEKEERLDSGQLRLINRIYWSRTYLAKAGLVEIPSRGKCKISGEGLHVLKKGDEITVNYLKDNYPSFLEFVSGSSTEKKNNEDVEENVTVTPSEAMNQAHKRIQDSLADELLNQILKCSPTFFEKLVVNLMIAMGYGGARDEAGETIGRSGDEGIDGIIHEDVLGLENIYLQAKRWSPDKTVGRPDIQGFVGALAGKKANKGIFITTSRFTQEAKEYALQTKVILIDGDALARYMIKYNVGVSTHKVYEIKRIDTDYFEEDTL